MKHELLWNSDRYSVVRVGDVYVVNQIKSNYDDAYLETTVIDGDKAFVEFVPAHVELLPLLAQFEIVVTRKEG